MQYSITIPGSWADKDIGYRARLKHPGGKSSTLKLFPGRTVEVDDNVQPASTLWVEEYALSSGRAVKTLAPGRKRLSNLQLLSHLPRVAYKGRHEISDDLYNKLLSALHMTRYLSVTTLDPKLHRLSTLIGRFTDRKVNFSQTVVGTLLQEINFDPPADNDNPALGHLFYLYWNHRIREILTPTSFHKTDSGLRSTTDQSGLEEIENEMFPYRNVSVLKPLVIALRDLLGEKAKADQVASGLTTVDRKYIKAAFSDMGALTYRSEVPVSQGLDFQWEWFQKSPASIKDQRPTILCSADPRFLGYYGPRWLYYAQFFPDARYHIHVAGNSMADIESQITVLQQLSQSFSTLSKHTVPEVEWSYSHLPAWVGDAATYYASARFLIARDLLQHYEAPIWIQDIDLQPNGDFMVDYSGFLPYDVLAVRSPLLAGLYPWKRYLAGSVFINSSVAAMRWLEHVEQYLLHFLPNRDTWMLDQNALSYAFDKVPELKQGPFSPLRVPLSQGTGLARRIERQ